MGRDGKRRGVTSVAGRMPAVRTDLFQANQRTVNLLTVNLLLVLVLVLVLERPITMTRLRKLHYGGAGEHRFAEHEHGS